MKFSIASAILFATFFSSITQSAASDDDRKAITCGSAIKLAHVETKEKYFLDSGDRNYGSGSGQQIVTYNPKKNDHSSLWIVREGHDEPFCAPGTEIKCGQNIRLTHVQSNKNLHSHKFRSPISNEQEVSAFGDDGEGDVYDNWKVVCDGTSWMRDEKMSLLHAKTKKYLAAMEQSDFNQRNCGNCPILHHLEAFATSRYSKQTKFKATLGIYLSK